MGQTKVQGVITADHKWITVTDFKFSDVTLIQAWYWNPTEFMKFIEDEGVTVSLLPINRHLPSNEKCWFCGTPVETGERFCNSSCKKAHDLNGIIEDELDVKINEK